MPTRRLALGSAVLLLAASHAQQSLPPGHWVNADPSDFQLLVLDVERDGAVHQLIPAPQFSATYTVEEGRLVMQTADGEAVTFVVNGDTLFSDEEAVFARLPSTPTPTLGAAGTWRSIATGSAADMESFMTLRSDSQVVLEVGFPVRATLSGDTLHLIPSQGPSASYVVRNAADTLFLSSGNSRRRLVRRPWGCLGRPQLDARAAECRG